MPMVKQDDKLVAVDSVEDVADESTEEVLLDTDSDSSGKQEPTKTNPYEEEARARGHVSKDEWVAQGNDPDLWRSAREFVERGELFGKINSQGKEINELKQAVKAVNELQKKAFEDGKKAALAKLKEEKKQAKLDGDVDREMELDEEIAEVRAMKDGDTGSSTGNNTSTQQPTQLDPTLVKEAQDAFINWQLKNTWYNENPGMKKYADMAAEEYVVANPSFNPKDLFNHIDKEMRSLMPERFSNSARGAAPAVGSSTTTKPTTTSNTFKLSDLPEEVQPYAKSYAKTVAGKASGKEYNKAMNDYLAKYFKD